MRRAVADPGDRDRVDHLRRVGRSRRVDHLEGVLGRLQDRASTGPPAIAAPPARADDLEPLLSRLGRELVAQLRSPPADRGTHRGAA